MTTSFTSGERAAWVQQMAAAMRKGDSAWFDRLLASADAQGLTAAADIAMRERRWAAAASLLDRIAPRDNVAAVKLCLSRNLAALQIHRPQIYNELVSLPKSDHCGIGTAANNQPTIVCKRSDGQNISLSPGNHPLQGLASAMDFLKPVFQSGQAFAMCGLGDGYLLFQLAKKPPQLFMDSEQCVFLLEPDAHVALTALMIHDYTGPTGPIEQRRFQWFIGSDWSHALQTTMAEDPYLPAPQISVMLGMNPQEIQAALKTLLNQRTAREMRLREECDRYYSAIDPRELAACFTARPPRKPRVLLITTRFSTVLQYATRDAVAGFEQTGWQTRLIIEPTTYHRDSFSAIRAALVEFKPDLVFQIDHQRQEYGELYPRKLPFVSWFQDHLPHLMKPETGEKIGATDFVLTDAGPIYVRNYQYPARQMIAMSKLTAPPPLLPRSSAPGEDLVFVSNAAHTPATLRERLAQAIAAGEAASGLADECLRRLIDLHDAGESLPAYRDVCQFADDVVRDLKLDLSEDQFGKLCWTLNHPVCDALYRRQTVRWIAAVAKDLGLNFGLYGKGWDQHPELAVYARGPIESGRAFNELCRRSAINFQIAPYLCLHQRLLDGVCSGAFFLVRRNIADIAPQAMLDLLETHCGPQTKNLNDARSRIPPPVRDRFERLVKDCRRTLTPLGDEDPIEMVRVWQEANLLVPSAGVLPHLDEISFSDPAELKRCIARFVRDPDLRERIAIEQRQNILGRLTYAAAIERMTERMGELLSAKPQDPFNSRPKIADAAQAA